MRQITLVTKPTDNYELLDSGAGEKLERYGNVVLARPDPQALWEKQLAEHEWAEATGRYVRAGEKGKWTGAIPKEWPIGFGNMTFLIRPTLFKHVGLFPEQLSNWEWASGLISQKLLSKKTPEAPRLFAQEALASSVSVLNLFAYTGGATLAAVQAGAEVTHVDASKTAVAWARDNAKLSGLDDKQIRWITEDVRLFVKREIKRGKRYDAIIMDPPAFGRGPKNEVWKIEENLPELIALCKQLLSEKPLFFLINGYAEGYSPLAFAYNLEFLEKKFGGTLEYGELTIAENKHKRLLPAGIFARWQVE